MEYLSVREYTHEGYCTVAVYKETEKYKAFGHKKKLESNQSRGFPLMPVKVVRVKAENADVQIFKITGRL